MVQNYQSDNPGGNDNGVQVYRGPVNAGYSDQDGNMDKNFAIKYGASDEVYLDEVDEEDEYIDEIYDIIDAVVPRTDDPTLPALTFRVWILGLAFGSMICVTNTIILFRTNPFSVSPFVTVLLAYPCGIVLERVLPSGILNPGRFNHKEHALIYVFTAAMSATPYALLNIIGQRYQLYQEDLSLIACFGFAIVTQLFGYGFAGLCRRFLVRPASMLWPSNLATIAMLNSLHIPDDIDARRRYPLSRFKFFWITAVVIACYSLVPQYFAPLLATVSILCYVAPYTSSPKLTRLFGSAAPGGGVGFLSFTLDWSFIQTANPITTPLWAMLNQYFGLYFFLWILVPLLWTMNAFGMDQQIGANPVDGPNGTGAFPLGFALNTAALFSGVDGRSVSASSLVMKDPADNKTLILNELMYNSVKPLHITTYFAMEYVSSFMVFVASIMHVSLWYGQDIYVRLRSSLKDLDKNDIHANLMDIYPEVPDWWYWLILGLTAAASIAVCQLGGFSLPWWGTVLAILLALVSIIPIGTIQAISGQQIGLNVMSEFIIGLILPGRIAAVMAFKTFSYMAMFQGLNLVQDLKLGHYLKVPPRSMFVTQLVSTVLGALLSTGVAVGFYEGFGKQDVPVSSTFPLGFRWNLQAPNLNPGWTSQSFQLFISAGAIWGGVGPARFFGPNSPYFKTLIGFVVGLVAPVIPWALYRIFPNSYWHLVNVPLIVVFPAQVGAYRSDLISPLLVAVGVNYFIKKYKHSWWRKYAYVMSAAFDSGTSWTVIILFFVTSWNANYLRPFPTWILNPGDGENCAPAKYIECKEHLRTGNSYGQTYDYKTDPDCFDFGPFQH